MMAADSQETFRASEMRLDYAHMFPLTCFALCLCTFRDVGRKRRKLGKKDRAAYVVAMRRRVIEIVDVLAALLARFRLNSVWHWSLASSSMWASYAQR